MLRRDGPQNFMLGTVGPCPLAMGPNACHAAGQHLLTSTTMSPLSGAEAEVIVNTPAAEATEVALKLSGKVAVRVVAGGAIPVTMMRPPAPRLRAR